MTSRTTPVGMLVLALAGIFVMGCNAQTTAVFEALLDPGRAALPSSEAGIAADDAANRSADDGWWPHPDGYAMTLPSGWSGVHLDSAEAGQLIAAVSTTYPELAGRIEAVLGATESVVSAIAVDPSAGELSPVLLVLRQPRDGRSPHEIKQHVRKQIAQLPGLAATPIVQDAVLPRSRGWRLDYSINDDDLGELRVRSYLFRYGPYAYMVNFVVSAAVVDDVDGLFDAIAQSLLVGV